MELEAVLKERTAAAGDPGRVLGAWVRSGWSAAGPSVLESEGGSGGPLAFESTSSRILELASKDNEPEYEALPDGSNVTTHMLAGAVAGVMEHCLMYPVDCVKTRMQSLQPDPAARYRNVMDALSKIVRTEGFWRPLRGLNVTATGAGPAHALYFACYEKLKKTLSDIIHPGGNSHIANGTDYSCPA
ncbi:mitoferrin-2A [Xenopus laevis]|uniref:Mitoferrin-2A n=1 Tax=Xenopus laevis TaxID=8355 RepID=MFN2A_XENLA|nr:mitoferrin-2A [Xenopus laevis]Q6GLJ0.1 RecName: Full=Mitoferrin-2A; AltName: Full=Mitochondrial iron transporter 2-A; AltName: Full=Solute carrier family 25 member 28-A [Xenopus laevis]AAH74495.1 MGC84819 protein [Xenopus laevis]